MNVSCARVNASKGGRVLTAFAFRSPSGREYPLSVSFWRSATESVAEAFELQDDPEKWCNPNAITAVVWLGDTCDTETRNVIVAVDGLSALEQTANSAPRKSAKNASTYENSDVVSLRTGLPGRPTLKHIILAELDRRIVSKSLAPKISAEALSLVEWFVGRHEDLACPAQTTVENAIRTRYWAAREALTIPPQN